MKTGSIRRVVAGIAALAAAACSILVDTKGLTGGDDTDPRGDGAIAVDGPTGGDSSGDSAIVRTDGGTDALSDAPTADACSGRSLCEDFEGTTTKAPWDIKGENGAFIRIDGDQPRSGLRSLHITRNAGNPNAIGSMRIDANGNLDIDCELDARVTNLGTTDTAEIAAVTHESPAVAHYESTYVIINPTQVAIGEYVVYTDGGSDTPHQASANVGSTEARWFHLRVHVKSNSVSLGVDDGAGSTYSRTMTIAPPAGRTTTTLFFGLPYGIGIRGMDVYMDNVRCTLN